jgi:protein tyrosine phosphatase (PTP) superfamily phosphohydrolase (DUF442 family)
MDISQITDHLFIAAHPKSEDVEAIKALNVRLIINMIFLRPAKEFSRAPFKLLTLRTFDSPFLLIPVKKLVRGVEAALPVIASDQSVLIYCREGRHRSVAMTCCILVGMGKTADEAMRLVKEQRSKADPDAAHIQRQICKFERQWVERNLS